MLQELAILTKTFLMSINLSDAVTSIATLILALLTFIYVRLTGKILSSQTDPFVILTVVHDEDRPSILQLVAKNVGSGLARDIRFEFLQPIPFKAFGLTIENSKKAGIMTEGPFINGIPALGPGECRKMDWGQFGGLKASIGESKIIATCRFKKNSKEMEPVICPLDVESFQER